MARRRAESAGCGGCEKHTDRIRAPDPDRGTHMLSRVAVGRARLAVCAIITGLSLVAATTDTAQAKKGGYSPPTASLVFDANSGKVLHSSNADALRHPASITKVMTIYLVFEEIERGNLRMDSRLKASANAAAQSPSKIGIRAGETISVEDAVKALVTKSANDVAMVIAENLAGSQEAFAERMTRKARALGMSKTVYRNPHGLPDSRQVTSARDLIILGRAIQEHFPKHYRLFQTRSFTWKGRTFGNHNKLLGRVEGVDGIKTGFIRASGFNLLSSVKDDGRYVVAVVLGGTSGASRDNTMRKLLATYVPKASRRRSTPLIALAPDSGPVGRMRPAVVAAAVPLPAPAPEEARMAAAIPLPAPATASIALPTPAPLPAPSATPAAIPTPREAAAEPAPTQVAESAPRSPSGEAMTPDRIANRVAVAMANTTTTPGMNWVVGKQPQATGSIGSEAQAYAGGTTPGSSAALKKGKRPSVDAETQPVYASLAAPALPEPTAPAKTVEPAAVQRSGWLIQIGATDDVAKAEALLDRASNAVGRVSKKAEPYTEPVQSGSATLYRARFAGFSERSAQQACSALKRSSMACFTIRN